MKKFTIRNPDVRLLFSRVLILFILAHFGHHLVGAMLRPLMPMMRTELGLDYTQVGLLISAFTITSGLSQVPAGWLADRFGLRLFVVIGVSGVAVAGLLIGLSPSYTSLVVFLVIAAILGSGYHPASTPIISALVPQERLGRALGFHMIGGSASMFIVPLLAGAIAVFWGWRGAYITLAIPAIVLGIVLYILIGRKAQGHISQPQAVEGEPSTTAPAQIHWGQFVPFIIMALATGTITGSVTAYMSLYLVDHFGVAEAASAMLVTVVAAPGLIAAPVGGYLSDRLGRVKVLVIVTLLTIPVVYLLGVAPNVPVLVGVMFIEGIINYIRIPNTQVYVVEHTPEHRRATIFGLFSFVSMEISGMLAPVVGKLIDRYGFYWTFTIASVTMAAITVVYLFVLWGNRERTPR